MRVELLVQEKCWMTGPCSAETKRERETERGIQKAFYLIEQK